MKLRILLQGKQFRICAEVNQRGRCGVEESLNGLERAGGDGKSAVSRFRAQMDVVANYGTRGQENSYFKRVAEGVWEFRCSGKARMLAWVIPDGRLLIIDVVLEDAKGGAGKLLKAKINEMKRKIGALISKYNSEEIEFE